MQTDFIFSFIFFRVGVDGVVIVFACICHVCVVHLPQSLFVPPWVAVARRQFVVFVVGFNLLCVYVSKRRKKGGGGVVFSVSRWVCGLLFGYL